MIFLFFLRSKWPLILGSYHMYSLFFIQSMESMELVHHNSSGTYFI